MATLENLHKNTCITEYTSMKKVNTILEFLFHKKRKGIPLKNTCNPFFLCKSKLALSKQILQLQPKARRERAKMKVTDRDYISADTQRPTATRMPADWHKHSPVSVQTQQKCMAPKIYVQIYCVMINLTNFNI